MSSRGVLPSSERGPADRNDVPNNLPRAAAWPALPIREGAGRRLLHRIRRSIPIQRRDERVRILRHQTAELWMVPDAKGGRARPMAFVCPTCSEKEEIRLLSVELRTGPSRFSVGLRSSRKSEKRPRILLRITR